MSPAPVLNDIERQNEATNLLASGKGVCETAEILGVSHPTISRHKANHQEAIQVQANKILAELPDMIAADIEEIKYSQGKLKEVRTDNKELNETEGFAIKIAEKKKENYMRSIGMLNAHTPAAVFQTMNIYNDNRSVISPSVLQALTGGARTSTVLPADVVINPDIVDK